MKTLVYVGANIGLSLGDMVDSFDRVYAFEPDPEMFVSLQARYEGVASVHLVNAACSNEVGLSDFYIYPNRVSSALSPIAQGISDEVQCTKVIQVPTINLFEFLTNEGVGYVDKYVSDCQGSDLMVLKTLIPFINDKKIDTLFVETHNDNRPLYEGLDNGFGGFREILSANYEFKCAFLGRLDDKMVQEKDIPLDEYEWDSLWTVR